MDPTNKLLLAHAASPGECNFHFLVRNCMAEKFVAFFFSKKGRRVIHLNDLYCFAYSQLFQRTKGMFLVPTVAK